MITLRILKKPVEIYTAGWAPFPDERFAKKSAAVGISKMWDPHYYTLEQGGKHMKDLKTM